MSSASPLELQLKPSRWQVWVFIASVVLGLGALFLLLHESQRLWVLSTTFALSVAAVRNWQRRVPSLGRFLIQADGFLRLPDSPGLWQLTSVSWFPGLCQLQLVDAAVPAKKRHVLIWRDQLDADTWRRLRVRLLPQPA